jgi:ketosteroid isomerase-like protein
MHPEQRLAVRQRIALAEQPRRGRHIDEVLMLRFPRLLSSTASATWRLPQRSRLRQAMLRRIVRLGIEASNRKDHEATFMLYHPDCACIFPPQMSSVGEPGVRGREARIAWEREWRTEWGDFHYVPEGIIDLGDGLLVVGRLEGSGVASGAAVDTDWAVLYAVLNGLAVREQVFFDREEAFAAAGLRE